MRRIRRGINLVLMKRMVARMKLSFVMSLLGLMAGYCDEVQ